VKRIQKFVAINLMAVLVGIPAMAAQHGHDGHGHGEVQSQYVEHRDGGWNDGRARQVRNDDRWERDRGYRYAPAPVYQSAPIYAAPGYAEGYYCPPTHNGRTAAIIGGSAAAGAVIGAVAGHGQGAVIGAVIGGIAGSVASVAANHHDHY